MRKFLVICFLTVVTLAYADNSKLSPDLQAASAKNVVVLIQYNHAPEPRDFQNLSNLLGTVVKDLPLVNGVVADIPRANIIALSNRADVKYISLDRPHHASGGHSAQDAINAYAAWQSGYTGKGIGVALIDSGVFKHPDLRGGVHNSSRVVYSQSFVSGRSSADDQYGHGTHVAGLIAGDGASSTGPKYSRTFEGVAPDANIINLRVLDENGEGTDSAVIAAIAQAINLKPLFNIRVINLSLGRGVFESYKLDPVCQAVEAAWKHGIVVVVAAGNDGRFKPTDGYGTINSPGNDPYVITVGATKPLTPSRTGDLMASYSSKGPTALDHIAKPDVVAPGNMLVSLEAPNSTLYDGYPGNRVLYSYYVNGGSSAYSSTYFTLSGTSMATGLVSGVIADLLQKSPELKPDQVKARLMKTAWKSLPVFSSIFVPTAETTYTDQDDVFTVGAGYVDVEAALADADVATETAMSPTANYDRKTGNVYLTPSASAVWNTSPEWNFRTVWGTSQFVHSNSAMWGAYAVWGNSAIWGNSAMWKNSGMWGNNDAWGSDTIWSDSAMWGSSIEAGEPN